METEPPRPSNDHVTEPWAGITPKEIIHSEAFRRQMEHLAAARFDRIADDPDIGTLTGTTASTRSGACHIRWCVDPDRIHPGHAVWTIELLVFCDDSPIAALTIVRCVVGGNERWSVSHGYIPTIETCAVRRRFGLNGSPQGGITHLPGGPWTLVQDMADFATDPAAIGQALASYQLELRANV